MLRKKLILGLLPTALVFAAFALMPAGASAAKCRVLTLAAASMEQKETCNEPNSEAAPANIRDSHDKTGISTQEEGFGADALASNIDGAVRFCGTVLGVPGCNETPRGYGFFGTKLEQNPSVGTCKVAEGKVEFVDFQHSHNNLGAASAVFSSTGAQLPERGPWTIKVEGLGCTNPGKVTISNVSLFITNVFGGPVHLYGEFTGTYENPDTQCPAGGMELDILQPGAKVQPNEAETKEFDNGTKGSKAHFCWVSSNNYVYPEKEPVWGTIIGKVWKD